MGGQICVRIDSIAASSVGVERRILQCVYNPRIQALARCRKRFPLRALFVEIEVVYTLY